MSKNGDHASGNLMETFPESIDLNNAAALQRALDHNAEELLWVAEVIAGTSQAGEQCLSEAIELAEAAQYVGQEWMFSWLKRLVVHVALKRIRGEIREFLRPAGPRSAVILARAGLSSLERKRLRSIPSQRIIASFDLLERTCFILYGYLQYPMLDCALLLGCPRVWIEPICERVLTKIVGVGSRPRMASGMGINANGRQHDQRCEDGEQGSALVPPACSCADLLHAGAIVKEIQRNSHDYK